MTMTKEQRIAYCLARAQGARLFTKDEKEAQEWTNRLEEEKTNAQKEE